MSYPCPTGLNGGQHKFGTIRFLTKDRQQFAQYCRYCKTIRTGRFVIKESGAPEVIYNLGLENNVSEGENPKLQVSEIETETGLISTTKPKDQS
jgi:hypothetical protein